MGDNIIGAVVVLPLTATVTETPAEYALVVTCLAYDKS